MILTGIRLRMTGLGGLFGGKFIETLVAETNTNCSATRSDRGHFRPRSKRAAKAGRPFLSANGWTRNESWLWF
jgi:hypothetical protein